MSNIELRNLTFGYGAELIFDHAQINIDDKWRLGLVGRNGRGKSTLLKLLQGEIKSDSSVSTDKTFVYFPQELTDRDELTFYALSALTEFEQWELERELTLLKVDLEVLWRPFNSLSGGEQTKCLLALLFLEQQNFALIDEPTNHLDIKSRETVANYLKKKSGFIVVSHDRDFLNQVCDHILAIERQQISLYQGTFSTYESEKKLRDEFELAEDAKLRKDISRLKQTAREKETWSRNLEATKSRKNRGFDSETKRVDKGFIGRKAANMMQKSKNLEKRMNDEIADKEKLLKNIEHIESLSMNFVPSHHKVLLRLENFSLGFDGKKLFQPLNFELNQGEIIAITGKNGAGKSSLIKYLNGTFEGETQGLLTVAHNISVAYVRQNYQNEGFLREFAVQNQLDIELFLSNLKKLGMERHVFSQKIETMSQGQQKKVELARALSQTAQLYIWDEPLNYLDVFNHEQIESLLKNVQPTLLVVEHDRAFINHVADKEIVLQKQ
ncbi:ribosomal protection-like ABC-F family protein [Lactococcus protaetiae]|uniref:ABC-F type ribosomal protection protein n=1 Tax=Lactococcus protaetiae TaxID=2592653 RepID=A0A514ZA89_9LACT|nr:ABC-F type ribosomal protection protein [Lactococcus protaetiae]QDK71498.1 ABC-F type ribosomal protection protein [Lactococcus protaetiae]